MKAKATLFVTFSDGIKRSFRNRDQDPSYGKIRIPSSRSVSYTNLFVNGVLQPTSVYKVSLGRLTLLSREIPEKGVPIILQFVSILGADCRCRKVRRPRHSRSRCIQ
ncbi:DUF4183 domain-containing protein [Paenibacillus sp. FJAT-26967]|uniref:DUF4183 domain-containing protein n=1 Tax=Paenibacillus sp. FJAT-26967 TaxID=1729690 RepID=UPI0020A49684|nr:DUF4183 domain-containing protein [Paenibacillus sp. FJAT-26967]